MSNIIEQAKARIAGLTGLAEEQINTVRANWREYMRQGLLANLHIGRWRGRTSLQLEDLGLPHGDVSDLVRLGEKRLLPAIPPTSPLYDERKPSRTYAQVLESIESAARAHLRTMSFPTYWGAFVPVTAFAQWREECRRYEAQYIAVRDEIAGNWESVIQALLAEYTEVARQAWLRMTKLDPDHLQAQEWAELDQYTAAFLDRILHLLPSREEFVASFYFNVELAYIPLPDLLAEEDAQAEAIRRQAEAQRAAHWQGLEEQQARHDAELARVRTERRMHETALEARERQLREMNAAVLEEARRQKEEQIDGFIQVVTAQLRQMVIDVATNVSASIANNGKLVGKAAQQLQNLIANVEQLNFTGDQELEEMLTPIKASLNQASGSRDTSSLQQALGGIAEHAKSSILAINRQTRGRRELDTPEVQPVDVGRRQGRFVAPDMVTPTPAGPRQARLTVG